MNLSALLTLMLRSL